MGRLKTRLREIRQTRGMTQEELAARVDVRRETIVHLEAGRHNPSLRLAWEIAAVFGRKIEVRQTVDKGAGQHGIARPG